MEFFKKLTKLMFWKKINKSGEISENIQEDVKTNALDVVTEEERIHKGDSRFEVVALIENVEANTVELGEQEHEIMDVEVKFGEIFEQEIGNSYEDAERKFRKLYEEETGKKRDSRYEDMEGNTPEVAEVETRNIGKDNNENVVPILQEHIEELKKKLEERDGLITSLQKTLEEKDSEMNEMEANFLIKISGLVKELEEKNNERCQVEIEEHVELKDTDEKYSEREQAEATLSSQIEEMKRKMEATEDHCQGVETLLKSETERRGKLQEKINIYRVERRDWKRVEEALRGQVKELKKKIEGMESDRGKLEEERRIYRREKCDWMRVEEALCGQVKELKKKIEGMESDKGKVEDTRKNFKKKVTWGKVHVKYFG